jgi:hypothetical protein
MVPADSIRVSRVRTYSGTNEGVARVSPTGLLPSTVGLSCAVRLPARFVTPRPPCGAATVGPTTPPTQRPQASTWSGLGYVPFRSPLLRESRIPFFSSGYSDVSFPRVPSSHPMCSGAGDTALPVPGSPIRRSVRQSPPAASHGLSQLATSFIGFRCQGIHHTPLLS